MPDPPSLVVAIRSGPTSAVRDLLDAGADPNSTNEHGVAVLALAALAERVDVMAMLLAAGAAVDGRDADGQTALHIAGWRNAEVIDLLVDAGADVNAARTDGCTPLHGCYFAAESSAAAFRALLARGADPLVDGPTGSVVAFALDDARRSEDPFLELLEDFGHVPVGTVADARRTRLAVRGWSASTPALEVDDVEGEFMQTLRDAGVDPARATLRQTWPVFRAFAHRRVACQCDGLMARFGDEVSLTRVFADGRHVEVGADRWFECAHALGAVVGATVEVPRELHWWGPDGLEAFLDEVEAAVALVADRSGPARYLLGIDH